MHAHSHTGHADEQFPTDTTGLELATDTETVEIADGGAFDLRIAPVKKQLGDATVRMLAYNGSVPGPTLKVAQGSEVTVGVENRGDLEATVHWHGLRLDNRYDGTHETQRPMEVGESFEYRLQFPDEGLYWFHPHIRQDYGQEMGLYGTILVVPDDPAYWAPGPPRARRHARRRPDRGRARSRRSARPRRRTRRWAASATAARQRRDRA